MKKNFVTIREAEKFSKFKSGEEHLIGLRQEQKITKQQTKTLIFL